MDRDLTLGLLLVFLLLLSTGVFASSDIVVWQGDYYINYTYMQGTYPFVFTVYDASTGGNVCFTHSDTLTTNHWGHWRTEESGVNTACDDVTKDYYVNINIAGVDQFPRRILTVWKAIKTTNGTTVSADITPLADSLYSLGSDSFRWLSGYFFNLDVKNKTITNSIYVNHTADSYCQLSHSDVPYVVGFNFNTFYSLDGYDSFFGGPSETYCKWWNNTMKAYVVPYSGIYLQTVSMRISDNAPIQAEGCTGGIGPCSDVAFNYDPTQYACETTGCTWGSNYKPTKCRGTTPCSGLPENYCIGMCFGSYDDNGTFSCAGGDLDCSLADSDMNTCREINETYGGCWIEYGEGCGGTNSYSCDTLDTSTCNDVNSQGAYYCSVGTVNKGAGWSYGIDANDVNVMGQDCSVPGNCAGWDDTPLFYWTQTNVYRNFLSYTRFQHYDKDDTVAGFAYGDYAFVTDNNGVSLTIILYAEDK